MKKWINQPHSQAIETSLTVKNSPNQDYTHPDDHIPPTYVMTPNHSQYEHKGKYFRPVPKGPP